MDLISLEYSTPSPEQKVTSMNMRWLPNRGPIVEPIPVDAVQAAITQAGTIATLMSYLHGIPGWGTTTPADLFDLAKWLLLSRAQYRDGGRWAGTEDR